MRFLCFSCPTETPAYQQAKNPSSVSPRRIELLSQASEAHVLSVKLRRRFFLQVRSKGIEPLLQDPQSCVLSVERRAHIRSTTINTFYLLSTQ